MAETNIGIRPVCVFFDLFSLIIFGFCQVKRRNSNESSTQWTTGIAEVQLPIEYALSSLFF